MQTTQAVAAQICSTRFQDLPVEVVEYGKALTLSALGAMIAGATRVSGRSMTRFIENSGGNPLAAIMGTTFRSSMENAAMANATFAHSTEYEDDSFPEAVSSYTIFPVALAIGEHKRSSGAQFLEAFVAGYETQARIGLACPEIRRRGMLTLSVAGALGCAATAAKLLKLDEWRTTMSLSLAASQCSGIAHQTGTTAHTLEMGIAARNGATAALLAAEGATGQADIFEAERGLFHTLNGGKVPSATEVLSQWGRPYRMMAIGIKSYPCCYHLQRIIEAIVDLRHKNSFSTADVVEVSVEVNLFIPQIIQYPEPVDEDQSQFSLHHAVAAALLENRVGPDSFGEKSIDAASFKAMRAKVKMIVREEWGWATIGWTPIITISLKSGEKLVASPERARGQPPQYFTFDEVVKKYRTCVESKIEETKIKHSIEIVRRLEDCSDVGEVVREVWG
jgi:2-methylcitrate dehydratase PrpD